MSMRDLLRARSEAPLEALELGPIIGRGSFGRVYRGQLPACLYQRCQKSVKTASLLLFGRKFLPTEAFVVPATSKSPFPCLLLEVAANYNVETSCVLACH